MRLTAGPLGPVDAPRDDQAAVVITDRRRSGNTTGVGRSGQVVTRLVRIEVDQLDDALSALQKGARGLFTDQTSCCGLIDAVRHVAAGRLWLAPELTDLLMVDCLPLQRRRTLARQRLEALSTREIELLALIGAGRTNA